MRRRYTLTLTSPTEFMLWLQSKHPGYGDRTGQTVLPMITPHETRMVVQEGRVISAIIDEKWDMIAQKMIQPINT